MHQKSIAIAGCSGHPVGVEAHEVEGAAICLNLAAGFVCKGHCMQNDTCMLQRICVLVLDQCQECSETCRRF